MASGIFPLPPDKNGAEIRGSLKQSHGITSQLICSGGACSSSAEQFFTQEPATTLSTRSISACNRKMAAS